MEKIQKIQKEISALGLWSAEKIEAFFEAGHETLAGGRNFCNPMWHVTRPSCPEAGTLWNQIAAKYPTEIGVTKEWFARSNTVGEIGVWFAGSNTVGEIGVMARNGSRGATHP